MIFFACSVDEKYMNNVTNDASLDENSDDVNMYENPTENENNSGLEEYSRCTYCFKGFTEAGIYSCKRDHHVCVNCRLYFYFNLTIKVKFFSFNGKCLVRSFVLRFSSECFSFMPVSKQNLMF